MIFILSGEITTGTKIDLLASQYQEVFHDYFANKIYSEELKKIVVIIVCKPVFGDFVLKQRKRFDRKNEIYFSDIILDYSEIMKADMPARKEIFLEGFQQLLPNLKKADIKNLDIIKFEKDLGRLLNKYK